MSGDAAGVLLGAAIAIPAIAIAGAGLLAYGAAKAIGFCAKTGYELYKIHKEEQQKQLISTNAQINSFYGEVYNAVNSMKEANLLAVQNAETAMRSAQAEISAIDVSGLTAKQAAEFITQINEKQNACYTAYVKQIKESSERNEITFKNQIVELESTLKHQLAVENKFNAAELDETERHNAIRARMLPILNQVEIELKRLRTLDTHHLISEHLDSLEEELRKTHTMAQKRFDEAALSGAIQMLTDTAILAARLSSMEEKRWDKHAKVLLLAKTLHERLSATETLHAQNPWTKQDEAFSLDVFTRNNHGNLKSLLEDQIFELEVSMGMQSQPADKAPILFNNAELDLMYEKMERVTAEEIDATIEEGIFRIATYCERLNTARTVSDRMEEWSSYRFAWISNEGGDPTAPLLLHLKNNVDGDEITLRLQEDEPGCIPLDLYDYQGNITQISEPARNQLRALLMKTLCTIDGVSPNGVKLNCVEGTEGKNSAQTVYRNAASTAQIPLQDATPLSSFDLLEPNGDSND